MTPQLKDLFFKDITERHPRQDLSVPFGIYQPVFAPCGAQGVRLWRRAHGKTQLRRDHGVDCVAAALAAKNESRLL